jgi:hypothetical protein
LYLLDLIKCSKTHASNAEYSKGKQQQNDVRGSDNPKSKHVDRRIAVVAVKRVVTGFVFLVDPE